MPDATTLSFPVADSAIQAVIDAAEFDDAGLIAAIAQEAGSHEIMMMAWMNEDALRETLSTGQVCYFSRSRNSLWRKGETSGQTQALLGLRIDCDGDAVLLQVEQPGVACHTGRKSCFYRALEGNALIEALPVEVDPKEMYGS